MPGSISVIMVGFTYLWLQRLFLIRRKFAPDKKQKAMKQKTDFLRELYADEAVCFIADRHNVTPQQLLHYLHIGEPQTDAAASGDTFIPLEPNEIEILKGLSGAALD